MIQDADIPIAARRSPGPRTAGWLARCRALLEGPQRVAPPLVETKRPEETSDKRFELLFEHVGEALLLCSRKGTILACNAEAARLCGGPAASVVGRNMLELLKNGSTQATAGQPETLPGESLLKGGDDRWHRVKIKVTLMLHEGTPQRLLHLNPIAPAASSGASRLHQLANFDSLTGLANRALFRDRLTQAMARAKRTGESMALMFLDLDRFKIVNDSLGHEIGDRLLVHVAKQLKLCLRTVDSVLRCGGDDQQSTLSRLGGDEFTVIAEAVGTAERAALVAQRLLEALAIPFVCGEEEIVIGASVGISLFPADDVDLDTLIRHTDMAMYRSKSLGRGIFTFYSDDLNEAVATRLSFEGSLRHAVERKEFLLHYQPKLDLHTGKVTGVEALLRWNCPMKGMIRPDRFITVLEDTGMIVPVGAWVIRAACADMAHWDRLGLPPLRMAVNMSARQFRHQHLVSLIEDTLTEHDIDPDRLEIELTETLLMEDNEASRNMFASFDRIGVRLAIDDFGTGHSSLAYLKRFNIDTLKIDRSFVQALPDDPDDAAIARAVIAMGHSMRMSVVAEGVETQAQADFLRELGCDEMQGYLLSRPLPGAELVDWLRAHDAAWIKSHRSIGGVSAPMPLMTLWESQVAA